MDPKVSNDESFIYLAALEEQDVSASMSADTTKNGSRTTTGAKGTLDLKPLIAAAMNNAMRANKKLPKRYDIFVSVSGRTYDVHTSNREDKTLWSRRNDVCLCEYQGSGVRH